MKNKILTLATISALLFGSTYNLLALAGHSSADEGYHGESHSEPQKPAWKRSLSKEQKHMLRKMKADFLKTKFALKVRIKTVKIDLAVLVANNEPDQKAIADKIDELLVLKKRLLTAKYAHKVAVRQQLTAVQQAGFDIYQLKKAKKKSCHRH